MKDAPGPGGERDRLWAFLSAAAYVNEALNIFAREKTPTPQKAQVEALARKSGATDGIVQTIDQLADGTHPISDLVTRVRNKLTFHWDRDVIGLWIDRYDNPSVMWLDARGGNSNGDTFYRAAADSAVYSIVPPTEAELALPKEERDAAVKERFKRSLPELTVVMELLADYFHRAIATHLREAGATVKPAIGAASDETVITGANEGVDGD